MSIRVFGYLILTLGALSILSNITDEIRGTTSVSSMGRGMSKRVSKDDPNSNFRGAMAYNWFVSVGLLGAGWFTLALLRHYDRHDLLSPKFDSDGDA
jgi:hypothetical protein